MPNQPSQILFEDENLLVRAVSGDRTKAAVSFASLRERKQGFGEAYFTRTNTPAVYFISKADNWYLTPSTMAGCAVARTYLDRLGFGAVFTYGTSMGAYGAAMCSTAIQADSCLLLAPQWSANPAAPPYEERWKGEARSVDFSTENLAVQISLSAQKWIIADLRSPDAKHAIFFNRVPKSEIINMPFGGHFIPAFLQECGALKAILDHAYSATLSSEVARRLARPNRMKSSFYWETIGRSAFENEKRFGTNSLGRRSIPFMRHAHAIAPKNERIGLSLAHFLIDAGRADEALAIFKLVADLDLGNHRAWRGISRCHTKLRNFSQAVAAARFAAALAPESEDLKRVLARTLSEVRQYDAAITVLVGENLTSSSKDSDALMKIIVQKRDAEIARSSSMRGKPQ
ncbi:tetratricopeptide repeat protein [Teichococcus wenyumeiae]|uniref:tetratricopeptide repeat protein n=1 Tax=Teichococcus wenyumeiae TaxID=2478470 RepID=UPI0011C3615D|nr:tetratricopeptide repeat protein [Pseudoroseomonas wenyumeiae]